MHFVSSSQKLFNSSESLAKMGDEVASLLNLFNSFKMAGRSATLVLSTKGGKTTTAKLEVELSNNKAPSTLPTPPGCQGAEGHHRPQRSAAKRVKANARAAQHQVHLALPFPGGDYGAVVGPPRCSPTLLDDLLVSTRVGRFQVCVSDLFHLLNLGVCYREKNGKNF